MRFESREVMSFVGAGARAALWLIVSFAAIQGTRQGIAEEIQRTVFPLSPYDEPVTISVTVGGKERQFVLDTGSSFHVYHESLRELLEDTKGKRQAQTAFGSTVEVDEFRALPSRVGNEALSTEDTVMCLDLSSIRAATGRNIEGVLGMPWFRTHIVQLDFDGKEIVILPAATKPTAEWGGAIAVHEDSSGVPEFEVEAGGDTKVFCFLDTGMNGSISLASTIFSTLVERQSIIVQANTFTATAAGIASTRKGTLSTFRVGEFNQIDLLVSDGRGRSCVGLDYLRRFRVTLDLGNGKLYLVPGAEYQHKERAVTVGFASMRIEQKTLVLHVLSDSPSEKAGILAYDELRLVNGRPIDGKPIGEIRAMLLEELAADGGLNVTMRRGSEELTFRVRD
jgi:hypothetical protein